MRRVMRKSTELEDVVGVSTRPSDVSMMLNQCG